MKFRYLIVDVFSPQPFGGNQLAVLTEARALTTEAMQAIAREFNFAETTFVLPPTDPANSCRIRIFTPRAEVAFAGHPTIGTACALAMQNASAIDCVKLVLEEGVGPVRVFVRQERSGLFGELTLDYKPQPSHDAPSLEELADVPSVTPEMVLHAAFGNVGIPFCLVRLDNRASVDHARLDLRAWERVLAPSVGPQIFFYAGEVSNRGKLYARMFAPAQGIEEDPATGSACAALVAILATQSGTHNGGFRLSVLQGVLMGRASAIEASAAIKDGKVCSVSVTGATTLVADGEIHVPEHFLEVSQ